MRMRSIAIVASLLVATPIIAQQAMQVPGARDAARVTAGTYIVDPNHTLVSWEVDHLGFTPYFGLFGDSTGTLVIDPKKPNDAKVDITIPVSKVTTASAGLTAHLLRAGTAGGKPDFFGPSPADAHFISTSVVARGQTARVAGDFTLNGITKPVTLDVEFYGAGKMPEQMGGKVGLGFTATTVIKRSDFGINAALPLVSDQVKLKIAVGFNKN